MAVAKLADTPSARRDLRKPRRNIISHSKADKAYLFTKGKDPLLIQVINLIEESGYSIAYISEKSGVSGTTIRNWIGGKTMRPQNVTMDFVLRVIGYERRLVKIGSKAS